MKTKLYLEGIIFIFLVLQSCSTIAPAQVNGVRVSFASECCGINGTAVKILNDFLAEDKRMRGFAVSYTKFPWGDEGEFDVCLPLNELNQNQKRDFINSLRFRLFGMRLVSVTDDDRCK